MQSTATLATKELKRGVYFKGCECRSEARWRTEIRAAERHLQSDRANDSGSNPRMLSRALLVPVEIQTFVASPR
ncbi:hypothetical protein RSSM_04038 [Rhodopirellula sallentina SM41]|uniref:Uncharacterized protein n=1 Tax=Rhodopirellula sallentina SM41 TaxID=1263870 RepID=M5TZC9_9BACT|nr:hypothetical protein RSSM_04038 [Rhodopirellula sallentina SM41]